MLNKLFFREALKQLRYRKFKSFMIIFSISISISFFIGITSIGEGIRVKIIDEIAKSEDLTLIDVKPGNNAGTITYITDYHISYIDQITKVSNRFPFVLDSYVFDSLDLYFDAVGVESSRLNAVFNMSLSEGAWFTENTCEAVLGYSLAEKVKIQKGLILNDNFSARIRIYESGGGYHDKLANFTIKGILNSGSNDLNEKSINNLLFFNLSMALSLDEKTVYDGLVVKAKNSSCSLEIAQKIESDLLLDAHTPQEEIDAANNFASMITIGLGFFSSLTLLLGIVLIITITTISIYQRTTEIGTMKAIGASNSNIIKMIIYECAILGIISGILGMIGGVFFAILIDNISKPLITSYIGTGFLTSFQLTIITPQLMFLGFILAFLTCVLSGVLPSLKAARLNPVDALKHI